MQGIKDCRNCKYFGQPRHSFPCSKCVAERYSNGPGNTVTFTMWQEMPINAEEYVRSLVEEETSNRKDMQGIGMKHDKGKPRLGILIREFAKELEGVGAVLTFGAEKYEEGSWMLVPDAIRRYEDAFMRHLLAIKRKEHFDAESGLPHVYHALTNLMFLAYFYEKENASV